MAVGVAEAVGVEVVVEAVVVLLLTTVRYFASIGLLIDD